MTILSGRFLYYLNDIMIFVNVAEHGSLTRAAKQLRLSLPYVSKRVKFLEHSLNTQLFIRSTRHFALTDIGQKYYDRCRETLQHLDDFHEEMADQTTGLKGTIRIYSPLGFGEQVLPDIIFKFHEMHPEVFLDVRVGELPANPIEKAVDVAIRTSSLNDSTLAYRDLGELSYRVCAAPELFGEMRPPQHAADLKDHPCLVHANHPDAETWTFDEAGANVSVKVSGKMRLNSGALIYMACERGLGIARLPEYDALKGIAAGKLVEILPRKLKFARPIRAYYPRAQHMPARVKAFLDFIQENVSFLDREGQAA